MHLNFQTFIESISLTIHLAHFKYLFFFFSFAYNILKLNSHITRITYETFNQHFLIKINFRSFSAAIFGRRKDSSNQNIIILYRDVNANKYISSS